MGLFSTPLCWVNLSVRRRHGKYNQFEFSIFPLAPKLIRNICGNELWVVRRFAENTSYFINNTICQITVKNCFLHRYRMGIGKISFCIRYPQIHPKSFIYCIACAKLPELYWIPSINNPAKNVGVKSVFL